MNAHINMHVWTEGQEKYLPLEDLFIKCAVKSCQAFHIRAHFPASGYSTERVQTRVCHCVISTSFTNVYYSYSINSVLLMGMHRYNFIYICKYIALMLSGIQHETSLKTSTKKCVSVAEKYFSVKHLGKIFLRISGPLL